MRVIFILSSRDELRVFDGFITVKIEEIITLLHSSYIQCFLGTSLIKLYVTALD